MVKSLIKILLVEDSPSDAKLIKHELSEDRGYSFEVIWVSRVDEAISELNKQRFDVALLDLTLPDSDGIATFNRIHTAGPQQLPIIILTGTGNEEIGTEAISLGAQDYLVKGNADSKSLTRAIRYSIERKLTEEALRKSEEYFRSITQNSADIIIIVNKLGIITYVSPSTERFTGYKTTELIGKSAFTFITAADGVRAVYDFGKAILTKEIDITNFFHIKHKNGSEIILEGLGKNLLDDPAVEGFVMNVRDVTERKLIEDTQLFLLKCGWSTANEDFFESLARYLAETLHVDFVCIDSLEKDSLAAQTVAVYFDGKFDDNISYTLKDTPCGDVVGKMICSFPSDVRHLFPNDAVLQEMKAESYVGTTLWSSKGKPIGLIALISRRPMINIKLTESLLQLAAIRAAGELERKNAEDELKERSAQLEFANKELESFSYSISHDLRAPLRAIDGYSRMILKKQADKFDQETQNRFNAIRSNTKMMGQLIDNLLAFSRLGRQEMSPANIDMHDLACEVWQELQNINPNRLIDIKINRLQSSMGDKMLIKQVLSNIMSNAIKFTRMRDKARIEVGGYKEGKENVYYVRDNGAGFDMEYYNKLFGVFQRLHSMDDFEGTGVGLAIVQRIIHRHGGRVWAEGEVDKGATFYFTLLRKEKD